MKIKKDVILAGLSIKMRPVLIQAEKLFTKINKDFVITSALDGVHSAGSLHYYGFAIDIRTRHISHEEKEIIAIELRAALGSDYDVVIEPLHIHVEYDPK